MATRWRRVAWWGLLCIFALGVVAWAVWPRGGRSPAPVRTPIRPGELEVLSVPRSLRSLAWSPDSKLLAVVLGPESHAVAREQPSAVQLWDVERGTLLRTLVETANPILDARFAPDGQTVALAVWRITGLAGGNNQSVVELRDPDSGRLEGTLAGAKSDLLALGFSRDGRLLAAGGKVTSGPPVLGRHLSGEVIEWDVETGNVVWQQTRGHTDNVYAVAFSPDGAILASAGDDKVIRLWDAATGKPKDTWYGHGKPSVSSLAFSHDGARLVSGGGDGTVHWWDAETGRVERITTGSFAIGAILCVDVSPDGRLVAAGGTVDEGSGQRRGRVLVWDATTAAVRHDLAEEIGPIRALAFSPDGTTLAIGSHDGKMYLWRPGGGWLAVEE